MVRKFVAMWKNYAGNNKINISGEILLSNKDATKLLKLTSAEQKIISELHCKLINKFPYIKTEMVQGMCEVSIKVFAYNTFTNNKDFLNDLCTVMEYMVKKLLEDPEIAVRLNVFGDFTTTKLSQQFRYLNKQDVVEYSITGEKQLGPAHYLFSRAIRVYFLVIVILSLFIQTGYLYYVQTYPNKLSEFLVKYLHLSQNV